MGKRTLVVSVVILLLIVCTTWAFWPRSAVDPVKAILQKHAQVNGPRTPQQREEMRAEMKQLTEEQRRQVWEARMDYRMRQMQRDAAAYAALRADQRQAFLDKKIEEMEKRRQEWAASRQQDGGAGGPGAGGGGPGGGSGNGQQGGPGGGRGRDATGQRQVQRIAAMMDKSTPMERAQLQQYMSDMSNRRQQSGLSGGGMGYF